MITITLQKIRDKSPRAGDWAAVLGAHKHHGMDTEFPLISVINSNDLDDALWCLGCLPEHDSLWRKYAVWCCRQVAPLLTDVRSLNALSIAWQHSNGEANDADLTLANLSARAAACSPSRTPGYCAARAAAYGTTRPDAGDAARFAACAAARAAKWNAIQMMASDTAGDAAWAAARDKQQQKLIAILTAGEWVDDADSEQLRAGGE